MFREITEMVPYPSASTPLTKTLEPLIVGVEVDSAANLTFFSSTRDEPFLLIRCSVPSFLVTARYVPLPL